MSCVAFIAQKSCNLRIHKLHTLHITCPTAGKFKAKVDELPLLGFVRMCVQVHPDPGLQEADRSIGKGAMKQGRNRHLSTAAHHTYCITCN